MPRIVSRLRGKREDGFTLVEVLVVVVLIGVVGAVFASTVIQATQVDDRTRTRADAQYSVTLGMDRITERVRVAAPLVSVSSMQLVVDVFPTQPATGSVRERHSFTLASGQLTHRIDRFSPSTSTTASTTSSRVLAESVDPAGSSFTGRDRAGVVTTTAAKVASVDVALRRTTRSAKPVDSSTTIFLRNFKG